MTITLLWYHIPALLSVIALCLAIWWPDDGNDFAKSFNTLLRIVGALVFISAVWMVTAILKG